MAKLNATKVTSINDATAPAGAFEVRSMQVGSETLTGLWAVCPAGDERMWLPCNFHERGLKSYTWDGNDKMPTIKEIIEWPGQWKGYLTKGVWTPQGE